MITMFQNVWLQKNFTGVNEKAESEPLWHIGKRKTELRCEVCCYDSWKLYCVLCVPKYCKTHTPISEEGNNLMSQLLQRRK